MRKLLLAAVGLGVLVGCGSTQVSSPAPTATATAAPSTPYRNPLHVEICRQLDGSDLQFNRVWAGLVSVGFGEYGAVTEMDKAVTAECDHWADELYRWENS
jgi:hypothetical protein